MLSLNCLKMPIKRIFWRHTVRQKNSEAKKLDYWIAKRNEDRQSEMCQM